MRCGQRGGCAIEPKWPPSGRLPASRPVFPAHLGQRYLRLRLRPSIFTKPVYDRSRGVQSRDSQNAGRAITARDKLVDTVPHSQTSAPVVRRDERQRGFSALGRRPAQAGVPASSLVRRRQEKPASGSEQAAFERRPPGAAASFGYCLALELVRVRAAAAWPSRTRTRDRDPPEQGVSNRSLSFAGSAQRLRVPTSGRRSRDAKRGGAESAPSSYGLCCFPELAYIGSEGCDLLP